MLHAYVRLWDEVLGVAFGSEIDEALLTKTTAVHQMEEMTGVMEQVGASRHVPATAAATTHLPAKVASIMPLCCYWGYAAAAAHGIHDILI